MKIETDATVPSHFLSRARTREPLNIYLAYNWSIHFITERFLNKANVYHLKAFPIMNFCIWQKVVFAICQQDFGKTLRAKTFHRIAGFQCHAIENRSK